MIIKWSGIGATEGRGKLGGTVASRNKAGAYFRKNTKPTNPQTAAQSAVRALLAALAQAWRNLSAANKATWDNAVANFPQINKVGDQFFLSGFGLYMKLNMSLSQLGLSTLSAAPAPAGVTQPGNFVVSGALAVGTMTADWDNSLEAGYTAGLYATPPISAGKSNAKTELRLIKTITGVTPGPVTDSFEAEYIAAFGALPAVGDGFQAKLVFVNEATGERSADEFSNGIMGA